MNKFAFIFIASMLTSCNWLQYYYSIEYHYGDEPSRDLNGEYIDSLLIASNGEFSILNEKDYWTNNNEFKEYYTGEYREKDNIIEATISPEYTNRIWKSYWRISDQGYYEECNRNGKLKRRRPISRFKTEEVTIEGFDSIVDIKEYWISNQDTIQSGFATKDIYNEGSLVERWNGNCFSFENPCDWLNINQCTVRRYEYLTNDTIQYEIFDCDEINSPFNRTLQKIERDIYGREISNTRKVTILRDSTVSIHVNKYIYNEAGYLEKYERYVNDEIRFRKTVSKL